MSLADKKETELNERTIGHANYGDDWFWAEDVQEAVKRILKKIRELPNRDDTIDIKGIRVCVLDGGGVGKFEVLRIIEEETGIKER